MNIKKVVPLMEDYQQINTGFISQDMIDVDTSPEIEVIEQEMKQFKLSCGVIFARINENINNPFGLKYFFLKSNSEDRFFELITETIQMVDEKYELSSTDINKLLVQYKLGEKLYKDE